MYETFGNLEECPFQGFPDPVSDEVGSGKTTQVNRLPDGVAVGFINLSAAFHLKRLKTDEVGRYIAHRLTLAGGSEDIFDDEAIRLIAAASEGIPRLINTLCDLAMVYGFSEDKPVVGAAEVRAVLEDRRSMGLPGGEVMSPSLQDIPSARPAT